MEIRKEYPRPDFVRRDFINLNGLWNFEFDEKAEKSPAQMGCKDSYHREIAVPFSYQSKKSGIGDDRQCAVVWYQRTFELGDTWKTGRTLLKFAAVDHVADVWVNGQFAGGHKGGYTCFALDITNLCRTGENTIVVKAADDLETDRPRGKQYWKEKPDRCWYTATTGIWKPVWLEHTDGDVYLEKIRMTPDIDRSILQVQLFFNQPAKVWTQAQVSYQGEPRASVCIQSDRRVANMEIALQPEDDIGGLHLWSPGNPSLYDIDFQVSVGTKCSDQVSSYFAMRKIHREGRQIFLNNRPLFQRLVLDQGYWEDGLLTPPSDEAIRFDVETTLAMGFNGARKHQKLEDPRYYYWADKLGLLVWAELPSAYDFHSDEVKNLTSAYSEMIDEIYNHPSVIALVPFNESWGIRNVYADKAQQNFERTLYYLSHTLDGTRLVSANDGWEMTEATDIFGIHDYDAQGSTFLSRYSDFESYLERGNGSKMGMCEGIAYAGAPFLITEYGGVAFEDESGENWGYRGFVRTQEEFLERVDDVTSAICSLPNCCGFCYTQLTDVMQEINGLMTMDRKLKVPAEKLRAVFGEKAEN